MDKDIDSKITSFQTLNGGSTLLFLLIISYIFHVKLVQKTLFVYMRNNTRFLEKRSMRKYDACIEPPTFPNFPRKKPKLQTA